ncbi:MAG: hypothetical protein K0R17_1374 [Rariglobus sp.]|nr:hypothetical protein [Rariglobus sp.]
MNTFIKPSRVVAACAVLVLSCPLFAEGNNPPQPQPPGYNEPGPGVTTKESMVSRGDRKFLEKAAESGLKEVTVSQAVLANLSTPEAREFAQMMVKDHTAANEELKMLAMRKSVPLPPEDKKMDLTKKWSEKPGNRNLDEDYLKEMVSDHKDAVELFEKGTKADDPDIAAFARKTLPTLKHHLELAQGKKHAH